MERVLLISYFFPPCNLTASQRTFAWARYLPEFGFEPLVITRNWDVPVMSNLDMSRDSGSEDRLEIHEGFKVWYMAHKGNVRDQFFVRFGHDQGVIIRKGLSLSEMILQNYFIRHLSFVNIYDKAREILTTDPTIRKIVVSAGGEFVLFQFCWRLKREFPYISWIADYRDDWTTSELTGSRSLLENIIYRLESSSEKKWISNATCITSVSSYYVSKIAAYVGKRGYVIQNGFSEDVESVGKIVPLSDRFIINYTGSLYDTQQIEIFLEAFKKLKKIFEKKMRIVLQFPGLSYDKRQEARVKKYTEGLEEDIMITERMPKAQVMQWQQRSNLMVMIGHKGLKGISSSKLYEYVGLRKRVLFVGNDHDIIEQILRDSGLGIFCETVEEIVNSVSQEIEKFIANPCDEIAMNEKFIESLSRRNQVKKLTEVLNSL